MITSNNSKAFTRTVFGLCAFIISYWGVQQLFFKSDTESAIVAAARKLNESCPMMVDAVTRLDSVASVSDKVFQYHYTTLNFSRTEVDLDTLKKYMASSVINNVRTNPSMKVFRDNEITLLYAYRDQRGELFYTLSVTPEMYK